MDKLRTAPTRTKRASSVRASAPAKRSITEASSAQTIVTDRYRAFVFPNRIREQRQAHGFPKLMALSDRLPDIPYIRLSKIERGEVVARASELIVIARQLDVAPADLLIDVDGAGFDIAEWARPFEDRRPAPDAEEQFAVLLASALKVLRSKDSALTIAVLDEDYGLPPVILSRLENAYKTFDRWNADTVASVCRLFGVNDESALRGLVASQYRSGYLDHYVGRVVDPRSRHSRTRDTISGLRAELSAPTSSPKQAAPNKAATKILATKARQSDSAGRLMSSTKTVTDPLPEVAVYGAHLPGGLIALTPTNTSIPSPVTAGPRAFALRIFRATLGAGLPANSIVVVDPDRSPVAGSLAAIRTEEGYRLVTVTFDRSGATKGYSVTPDLEFDIDELDSADVHAVVCALFP